MQLERIREPVGDELRRLDAVIVERLASDVVLVNQVSRYIIGAGGKRLRPLAVLLAARACGYAGDRHVEAAAVIEFIHTATLLHDDVVDGSDRRRGRDTANHVYGNQASVLVGDYLYSRAFQMMVDLGDMRIQEVMANATNTIAMGEVLQLMNAHDADTTEQRYLEVIYRKTAKLFEAGAQTAAILAKAPPEVEAAMVAYGRHLGTAFQLVDDVLDYRASAEELGKNLGDDLAEGKPTLPLIHALAHASPEDAARLRAAVENGGLDDLEAVTRAIESSGGLEYTARLARRETDLALEALSRLPESAHTGALRELASFAVGRTY
ncbi:MAG: octaprenyl diphosphate synthase [Lysobacterales bacterium]|nr:MAG: octaprenyl diphosphate synthase [Xanthomonadales bacterium]